MLPPQEGTVLTPCSGTVFDISVGGYCTQCTATIGNNSATTRNGAATTRTLQPSRGTVLLPQGTVLPLWGTVLPPQEHCCHYTGNNASTTRNCATTTENRAATRGTVLLPGEHCCPHSVKCCYQGNSADTMPSLPPQETLSYQHTSFKLQK